MKKQKSGGAVAILLGSFFILIAFVCFLTFGIINIGTSLNKNLIKEENKSDFKNVKPFSFTVNNMLNTPLPCLPPTLPYVALTFDDGPYAPTTSKVLNSLKKRNVKATFFVIGYRAEINKKLLQEMVSQGHEIGNHSWDHPDYTTLNKTEIKQQQEQCAAVVEQYTGEKLRLSRPPYGGNNKKVDETCNTPIVLWSMDSLDWQETDRRKLINRVVNQTRPGDIILMHDLQKITAECIDEILDGLLAKGYFPVTVSDLIAANHGTTLQRGKIYYSSQNITNY